MMNVMKMITMIVNMIRIPARWAGRACGGLQEAAGGHPAVGEVEAGPAELQQQPEGAEGGEPEGLPLVDEVRASLRGLKMWMRQLQPAS